MSATTTPILVVDDDQEIRESLKDVLEDAGYAVVAARHGAEALAVLEAAPRLPALILLDLSMPVMDGETFRQRQRAVPALADIPVVVLSASAEMNQRIQGLALAGHLRKPVRLQDLLAVVRRFAGPAV